MISGLSPSILQNYAQYVGSSKAFSTSDMFVTLSKELGGDGETITKADLGTFIEKNSEAISPTKLKALETLQSSWDTISGGKDSISYDNMKGYTSFLGLIYTSDRITSASSTSSLGSSSTSNSSSAKSKINDILISSAIGGNGKTAESGESALSSYLKKLLSENSDDNDNSDDIDAVVNMMASFHSVRSSAIDGALVKLSADYRV
jgi:hypothetical protein